jgi:hypothetical protein
MIARDDARRVAENAIAVLELRARRLPATAQTLREELRRRRLVVPHGDRRDRPESRRIKDEEMVAFKRYHDVVGVLVLCDDLHDDARRRVLAAPAEDIGQSSLLAETCLGASKNRWRDRPDT